MWNITRYNLYSQEMLSQQTCLMEFRLNVFCPTGLSGVKGEGMMELEPSEPLLEAFGEEEEEDDEEW